MSLFINISIVIICLIVLLYFKVDGITFFPAIILFLILSVINKMSKTEMTTPNISIKGGKSTKKEESKISKKEESKSSKYNVMFYDHMMQLTNPKFNIIKVSHPNEFNMYVIDESHLVGGSKQRILINLLITIPESNIVYAGPSTGYAQLAISYCCSMLGKTAIIFIDVSENEDAPLTERAKLLGAKIMYFNSKAQVPRLKYIQEQSEIYTKRNKNSYLLPFGMHTSDTLDLYNIAFQPLLEQLPSKFKSPARIWVVAGSGLIFTSLSKCFPSSKLMIVQVGKTIWPDQLVGINHELFVSEYKFKDEIDSRFKSSLPYNSLLNYDAKVWPFIVKHGQKNDFIWNTAGQPWEISKIEEKIKEISLHKITAEKKLDTIFHNMAQSNAGGISHSTVDSAANSVSDSVADSDNYSAADSATDSAAESIYITSNTNETNKTAKSAKSSEYDYNILPSHTLGMKTPAIMFKEIKKQAKSLIPEKDVYRNFSTDYYITDGISNHFTEFPRMKCRVNAGEKITPLEFWKKYKKDIIINSIPFSNSKDAILNIREALSNAKKYKECGTFNPFILINTIKRYFKPTGSTYPISILDPSMGWGDRLIGALSLNVSKYVGFDPNIDLHKKYDEINSKLNKGLDKNPKKKTETEFIPEKFAYSKISDLSFDLVFTSPPYFDFEVYTHTEADVNTSYKNWLDAIYIPYVNDMIKSVKKDGYVCIYISNIWNANLGDVTNQILKYAKLTFVEELSLFNDYVNMSVIVTKGTKRPLWVYKK